MHNFSELESSQRSITCGFEHDGIAHCQSGRDLPGQHQKRKIPGDDLTYHTHWLVVGELRFHELCPTCIVVKMASYKWNIDVTCFANRFAIIQRLQHGQQARVLLDMASNGIHIACAYMPWYFAPCFKSCARRRHSSINIRAISGSDLCQQLTRRWIDAIDILTTGRLDPLVIDEQAER